MQNVKNRLFFGDPASDAKNALRRMPAGISVRPAGAAEGTAEKTAAAGVSD